MRNNRLLEISRANADELVREGFLPHTGKNQFIALRASQTSLHPKVVILTVQHVAGTELYVTGCTVNATTHYPTRAGLFSETWRKHVNDSLLFDDVLDWTLQRIPQFKPERSMT